MSNISKDAKLAMIQALAAYLDTGSGAATLVFYDDVQPANTAIAANAGAALATLTFPEPCYKSVTTDYVELHPTSVSVVTKTGEATWARIFNGAGVATYDLAVGTDITINNPELTLGGNISLVSVLLRA